MRQYEGIVKSMEIRTHTIPNGPRKGGRGQTAPHLSGGDLRPPPAMDDAGGCFPQICKYPHIDNECTVDARVLAKSNQS